jgi:imidazolonepropionase-like amidohydrolase
MLDAADRIGTIEVGKEADLLLAPQNPLEHGMAALRDLRWVIRDGEARAPAAWLVDPEMPPTR